MNTVLKTGQTVEEAIEKGLMELGIDREDATIEIIQEETTGFLGLIGKKDAVVRIGRKQTEDISSFVKDILYDEEDEETAAEPVQEPEVEKKPEPEPEPVEATKVQETPETKESKETADSEESTDKPERIIWDDAKTETVAAEFLGRIIDEMDIEYTIDITLIDNMMNIDIDTADPDNLGLIIGNRGSTLDSLQHLVSLIVNNHREEYLRVVLDANDYRAGRIDALRSMARKNAQKVLGSGRDYKMNYMNPAERRIVHMTLQDTEGIGTRSEGRDPRRRVVIYKEN